MANVIPPAASAEPAAEPTAAAPALPPTASVADIDAAIVAVIDAAAIVRFHARQLRQRDWPIMSHLAVPPGIWHWIDANHRYNGLVWREQDRARRLDVPPADIVAGQHLIARYQQKRGDAVEAIDVGVLAVLGGVERQPGARLSTETAGELVDRLSMLALQMQQVQTQARSAGSDGARTAHDDAGNTDTDDAADTHIRAYRLELLSAQRQDAMARFDTLLAQVRAGAAYFKLQRPRTAYPDASLNRYPSGRIREDAAPYHAALR